MDRVSECACVRERVRENMIVSQCVIVLFDGHISRLGHFFLRDRGSNFFFKASFFLLSIETENVTDVRSVCLCSLFQLLSVSRSIKKQIELFSCLEMLSLNVTDAQP